MINKLLSVNDTYLKKIMGNIKCVEDLDCIDILFKFHDLLIDYKSEKDFMHKLKEDENLLFLYKTLKLISVQKEFDWRKWKIANILFDTVCPQISFTYDKNQLKTNEVIADFDIVENLGGDRRISMEKISVVVPDNGICIDTEMTLHDKEEEGSNTCISKALNKFKRKCC